MWKICIYFFAFSTVLLFQVCENLILAGTDFNIKSNDIKLKRSYNRAKQMKEKYRWDYFGCTLAERHSHATIKAPSSFSVQLDWWDVSPK